MKLITIIIAISVAGAAGLFTSCKRGNFASVTMAHSNHESCLQVLHAGIFAVRKYAEEKGRFPQAGANLNEVTELGQDPILTRFTAMFEYGGDDSLNLKSPERTIILKCIYPTSLPDGRAGTYCALLSGKIVLLPEKSALLGSCVQQELE